MKTKKHNRNIYIGFQNTHKETISSKMSLKYSPSLVKCSLKAIRQFLFARHHSCKLMCSILHKNKKFFLVGEKTQTNCDFYKTDFATIAMDIINSTTWSFHAKTSKFVVNFASISRNPLMRSSHVISQRALCVVDRIRPSVFNFNDFCGIIILIRLRFGYCENIGLVYRPIKEEAGQK